MKAWRLFWIWKFEIWIWNVTNQMIAFSALIQSGYRGMRHHFSINYNWFPFQCSKINKYEDHFFQCPLCHIINLLLTKLVRSRWLDISLILFLHIYGSTSTLSQSIKTQKENSANIQPWSWLHALSIIYTYVIFLWQTCYNLLGTWIEKMNIKFSKV